MSPNRTAAGVVLLACVLSAALMTGATGCGPRPDAAAPEAMQLSDQRLESLRQQYQRQYPGARVGRVVAALPEQNLVAIGNMDVSGLGAGTIVAFANARNEPLVSGRVVRQVGDTLHVLYDEPGAGQRAPAEGDLAVHVP